MTDPTAGSGPWVRARRLLDSPPDRLHRAWSDPDELSAWFCRAVTGSLSVGARSTLVWSDREVDIDVLESDPPSRHRFRWSSGRGAADTVVTVTIERFGYGSRLTLEDGPFDVSTPDRVQAFGDAAESWGEALANLRARVDFGQDLRRPVR